MELVPWSIGVSALTAITIDFSRVRTHDSLDINRVFQLLSRQCSSNKINNYDHVN